MASWIKYCRSKYFYSIIFLALIYSCSERKVDEEYVAKVNNTVLTESELEAALNSDLYGKKQRDEYIRQWVEKELLFQEAVEENIVNDKHYQQIIEQSKKELAAAVLLNNLFTESKDKFTQRELKSYFNKYINDFRIRDDSYVLNIAGFNEENRAVLFRYSVMESGWVRAAESVKNDSTKLVLQTKKYLFKYQVQPISVNRAVNNLKPGEVSIVLQQEPNMFTVVQLVSFLEKDSFPEFEMVEDLVRERYFITKKSLFYKSLIEELYSKYNVNIKKEVE